MKKHIDNFVDNPVGESVRDSTERFIEQPAMKRIVMHALSGRIDHEGSLLPLEESRFFMPDGGGLERLSSVFRNDIVLPPSDDTVTEQVEGGKIRHSWKHVEGYLYMGMTESKVVELTRGDVEVLKIEEQSLANFLSSSSEWEGEKRSDQGTADAVHIRNTILASEKRGIADTRVYIPSGLRAVELTRLMLEANAQFNYAKVWLPFAQEGSQKLRSDTPIYIARTIEGLRSTVESLRNIYGQRLGLWDDTHKISAGMPVEGLPGVFVGQTTPGRSFNTAMSELFSGPVSKACNSFGLKAGDKVTDDYLDKVSIVARELAYSEAENFGRSKQNHALLKDQPITRVTAALDS